MKVSIYLTQFERDKLRCGPALCAAADGAGIAIKAVAINDRLAQLYCDEVPGLVD